MSHVREPECAVRGNTEIVTAVVHYQEVFSRPLDDFHARLVSIEARHRIFEVVTCPHEEVLFLWTVKTLLSTPKLVRRFVWVYAHDGSDFGRADTALSTFQPLAAVFASDYLNTHGLLNL